MTVYCVATARAQAERARRRIVGLPLCTWPNEHGKVCLGGVAVVDKYDTGIDSTGLALRERDLYGLYGYGFARVDRVWLTHEQRVAFAALRAVVHEVCHYVELVPEGYRSSTYPLASHVVLRPSEATLTERTGRLLGQRLALNAIATVEHGAQRRLAASPQERAVFWTVKLALATKDWTDWPKVKGLRLTQSKEQRAAAMKARRAAKRTDPRTRLVAKIDNAACAVARWESKQRAAERKVKKWKRALARLERKLTTLQPTDTKGT